MKWSALAFIVLVALLAGACAPKAAPPATAGALRYADFVFPAPPDRVGDARARARLESAWNRLQAGDLTGAGSGFAQLVQQQPTFYPAAVGLGYVRLAQGKPKEAAARFDGAIRQAPRYGPALAGRGEALLAAGQRDAALAAFEAALAADASLGDLRRRIDALRLARLQGRIAAARRAFDAGRFDEARDAYADRSPFRQTPGSSTGISDSWSCAARTSRRPSGTSGRRWRWIRPMPGPSSASVTCEERGDQAGAISMLERAYALDPSDALKQRLDRLRERSQTSGLPPEYAAIPTLAQVTRGDVAALIGVRLRAVVAAAAPLPSAVATDVRGHWVAAMFAGLGIQVRNTPNAFTLPVTDSVFGYMLAFAPRHPWMDRDMKSGRWNKIPGRALHECTLGIIGVGTIGKVVARRARAFGMKILGNDIVDIDHVFIAETGIEMTSLDSLLSRSDFVSVNCTLNPTSLHLINTHTLHMMQPHAILINTARGTIVDEPALVAALQSGQVGGAAGCVRGFLLQAREDG